jgi:E3 ubiquitin-protein ligase HUWE1
VNNEHLSFFKFVGRVMGKAIYDGYHLDAFFTRAFYKHILGQEVTYNDMEDLDPDFYKNLKWLLDNNIDENAELFEYYFCYEEEELGRMVVKELKPGGKDERVTEANKEEYVSLICKMKMTTNIQQQIDAFLEGIYELIPRELIGIFTDKELELLISGLPEVDLDDLQ